ncbi:beta strand repeat-containing protein [Burkholderia sp. BCC1977]|uniref:beta strand repeat-containing protein n=1 Tax=Burkholderia sp. BCC1977 TaxID=2817440 RepID=UPI002ABD8B75|nr:MBG domain-containing protein [Burkholderia sp. BCC1977]
MNKNLHKLIFSEQAGTLIAVAESAVARGKGGRIGGGMGMARRLFALRRTTVAVALALGGGTAFGVTLPTGGQVSAGNGQIGVNGNVMTVQQGSDKLAINWQTYNIGAGDRVVYQQPNANSIALNRVLGGSRSEIYGAIDANGKVFLLNPSGVLFGKTAQVSVGGLLATTKNLGDSDFMAGNYRLTGNGTQGEIVNQGNLRAVGGSIVLVADQVRNQGTISTPGGSATLAAGDQVTLTLDAGGKMKVDVDTATMNALVENQGLIAADGGAVYLTARGRDMLQANVMNLSGVIRARSIGSQDGQVVISGGTDADGGNVVLNHATVDVAGLNAGGHGGTVSITGRNVGLFGSSVDARGDAGGGTVLIGGERQGKGTLAHANVTFMDGGSSIDASATGHGTGGTVVLWSDAYTQMNGRIDARGGQLGGDGGFVETSSHGRLGVLGQVSALAPNGKAGSWLLDPTDITVSNAADSNYTTWFNPGSNAAVNVNNGSLGAALQGGTNVTLDASQGTGTGSGWIKVLNDIGSTGNGSLSLLAANGQDVTIGANITLGTGSLTAHGGNATAAGAAGGAVVLAAGNNVTAANVTLTGGNGANGGAQRAGGAGGQVTIASNAAIHADSISLTGGRGGNGGAGTNGAAGAGGGSSSGGGNTSPGGPGAAGANGGTGAAGGAGGAVNEQGRLDATGNIALAGGQGGTGGQGGVGGQGGAGGAVGRSAVGATPNGGAGGAGGQGGAGGNGGAGGQVVLGSSASVVTQGTLNIDGGQGGGAGAGGNGGSGGAGGQGGYSWFGWYGGNGGAGGNGGNGGGLGAAGAGGDVQLAGTANATGGLNLSGGAGGSGAANAGTGGNGGNGGAPGYGSASGYANYGTGGTGGSSGNTAGTGPGPDSTGWTANNRNKAIGGAGANATPITVANGTQGAIFSTNASLNALGTGIVASGSRYVLNGQNNWSGSNLTFGNLRDIEDQSGEWRLNITQNVAVANNITGAGAVAQDSAGTQLTLSGANNFTGPANILAGTLDISGSWNVGSGTAAVNMSNGTTFLANNITSADTNITGVDPNGTITLGAINTGGNLAAASKGDLMLAGNLSTTNGNVTLTAGSDKGVSPYSVANGNVTGGDVKLAGIQHIAAGGNGKTVTIYSGNANSSQYFPLVTNASQANVNKHYATAPGNGTVNTSVPLNLFYRVTPAIQVRSNQNKVYGSNDPNLNANWTELSGAIDGDDPATILAGLTGKFGRDDGGTRAGENTGNHTLVPVNFTAGPAARNLGYAVDAGGNLNITPANLAIAANNQNKVYGTDDPNFTYNPTGLVNRTVQSYDSNGNPVSVTINDTPSNALTGNLGRQGGENVGAYNITRGSLDAVGGNYVINNFTPGVLNITQAQLTIAANDQMKAYGTDDPNLTYNTSGLINHAVRSRDENGNLVNVTIDDSNALTGHLGRQSGENVGNYTVLQGSLGATPNYNVTYDPGNLRIVPRGTQGTGTDGLNVTADNVRKVYGSDDPNLTYQVDGLVNGTVHSYDSNGNLVNVSLNDAAPTALTGNLGRQSGEHVGNYNITQGSLASRNYILTYSPAELNITPANLVVAADNQNKVYGTDDPDLTYNPSGLVNRTVRSYDTNGNLVDVSVNDTDALTGHLGRQSGENVGNYNITQGNLAATSNYNLEFQKGSLNITPATLVVTPDNQNKVYGTDDPNLTYNTSGLVNRTVRGYDPNGNLVSNTLNDAPSVLSGNLGRQPGEHVGAYGITQGSLNAANYRIAFNPATLAIQRATLAVIADDQQKTVGTDDPLLTYRTNGLVQRTVWTYDANGNRVAVVLDDTPAMLSGRLGRAAGGTVRDPPGQSCRVRLRNRLYAGHAGRARCGRR